MRATLIGKASRTSRASGWRTLSPFASIITIFVLGGCAISPLPDPEAAEYRRADSHIRAIEHANALKRSCRAAGGTVLMERSWGRFPPTVNDLRSARCVAGLHGLL